MKLLPLIPLIFLSVVIFGVIYQYKIRKYLNPLEINKLLNITRSKRNLALLVVVWAVFVIGLYGYIYGSPYNTSFEVTLSLVYLNSVVAVTLLINIARNFLIHHQLQKDQFPKDFLTMRKHALTIAYIGVLIYMIIITALMSF